VIIKVVKYTIFWDMMPCRLQGINRHFHWHVKKVLRTEHCHIPEGGDRHCHCLVTSDITILYSND